MIYNSFYNKFLSQPIFNSKLRINYNTF